MNSHFMFRRTTYINQVFNVNYQQFHCHLLSAKHCCVVPLIHYSFISLICYRTKIQEIFIQCTCWRATLDVQEVKVLHDASNDNDDMYVPHLYQLR